MVSTYGTIPLFPSALFSRLLLTLGLIFTFFPSSVVADLPTTTAQPTDAQPTAPTPVELPQIFLPGEAYFTGELAPAAELFFQGAGDEAWDALLPLESLYRPLATRKPSPERYFILRALVLLAKAENERALSELDRALALRGASPEALYLRACALARQAKLEEAQSAITEATWFLRTKTMAGSLITPAIAATAVGLLAAGRDQGEVAERELLKAVSLAPTAAIPRLALSELLLKRGDATGALTHARDARTHNPDDPRVALLFLQASNLSLSRSPLRSETGKKQALEVVKVADELLQRPALDTAMREQALDQQVRAYLYAGDVRGASAAVQEGKKLGVSGAALDRMKRQISLESAAG